MSQYKDDLDAVDQKVLDAQDAAKEGLELLRIAQAHPEIKFNMAVQALIREYFAGDPITLQDFENAYAIENIPGRQTLRNMIGNSTPQTVAQHNQALRELSHEELIEKARDEQRVREANQFNPVVRQVEPGTPILPAHITKRWLKEVSSDTVKSARITFDRQFGSGWFNRALEWRISGADALELRRLYTVHEGE